MTTFKGNRRYPNPVTVTEDPRSHTLALQQIIEALNTGQRRTRDIGNSFVRLQELVDVGLIEIVGNQLKLTNAGAAAVAGGASALADLTDVDLTGLADGDTLVYDSGTMTWLPGAAAGGDATVITIAVRNNSGATITKGSAVYINGSQGANLPTIALAQADTLETSRAIGLVQADISNNSNGTVVTTGVIEGINTSAFAAGDPVYVSPSVAGGLTNARPNTVGQYVHILGYVTISNVAVGEIKVLPGALSLPAPNGDATTYDDLVLSESPVGFWKFDEGTGTTVTDYGSGGNNLTISGTYSWSEGNIIPSLADSPCLFLGTSGYASAAALPLAAPWNGDYTIEAVVRLADLLRTEEVQIVLCGATGETAAVNFQGMLLLSATTHNFSNFWESGAGTDHANASDDLGPVISTGDTAHLAVVKDGAANTLTWYVNGRQWGSVKSYATEPTGGTSGVFTVKGSGANGADMLVARVALYDSALPAATIYSHANAAGLTSIRVGLEAVPTVAYIEKSASFNVAANNAYLIMADDVVATLPSAPADGDFVVITAGDYVANCSVARNGKNIMGFASDLDLDGATFTIRLVYIASATNWVISV